MRNYKKITMWENRNRVKNLIDFREKVVAYFNNLIYPEYSFRVSENDVARRVRSEINLCFNRIHSVIVLSGVPTTINYRPPCDIGIAGERDLLANMFSLKNDRVDPQIFLDVIEKSIGVYKNDSRNALIRTFNPFFWLGLILDYIVSVPIKLIGLLGFNQNKLENSIVGRFIKGVSYLMAFLLTVLYILQLTGYLDTFNSLIRAWIR